MGNDIFDNHDCIVDDQTNCGGETAEGHQIEALANGPHEEDGDGDGYRNDQPRDQRRRPVAQEKEQDHARQKKPNKNRVADAANAFAHEF
jgi:hypothetical protein